jgi:hypothetical protein
MRCWFNRPESARNAHDKITKEFLDPYDQYRQPRRARHKERNDAFSCDLAEFFVFVRLPTRGHPRREKPGRVLRTVATLCAFNALFALLVSIPICLLLQSWIGLTFRINVFRVTFVILSVAIAPLVEELVFRAGLRSARWTMSGMPALIALIAQRWQSALAIAAMTSLALLVDAAIRRRMGVEAQAILRWRRGRAFLARYPLIVHGYALAFALIHINNYVSDPAIGWRAGLVVFAVSSQLVLGWVLSFLRLRFGLHTSILAHGAWNGLAIIKGAIVG